MSLVRASAPTSERPDQSLTVRADPLTNAGRGTRGDRTALTVVAVSESDSGETVAAEVAGELARLRAENARLLRLLKLTTREAAPPVPAQARFFDAPPGTVHAGSPPEVKVAFFGALFAARTDIYAVRWENARTGEKGWLPEVARWGSTAASSSLPPSV